MPADPRPPAGGDEQAVAAQLAAVVELEDVLVAVAAGGARVRGEDELDLVAAQNLAERLAQRRRLPREDVLGHVDDHGLAPEAANRLGHLHPDRPAAEDQEAARNRRHRGHLAVAPDAVELLQARHRRRERVGAVGEDDVVGRVLDAVDLDHPGPGEAPAAADQIDLVVGQPSLLSGVGVVGDHEVAPGERGLDIDLGAGGGIARRVDRLAGAQQRLRGDAGPVGALPADELTLDDGDAQAALGQGARAVLAR